VLKLLLELIPTLALGLALGLRYPLLPGRIAPLLVRYGIPLGVAALLLRSGLNRDFLLAAALALFLIASVMLLHLLSPPALGAANWIKGIKHTKWVSVRLDGEFVPPVFEDSGLTYIPHPAFTPWNSWWPDRCRQTRSPKIQCGMRAQSGPKSGKLHLLLFTPAEFVLQEPSGDMALLANNRKPSKQPTECSNHSGGVIKSTAINTF